MSIEQALLALPVALRADFLAEAGRLEERARAKGLSNLEYQLALAVLLVLSGGIATHGAG